MGGIYFGICVGEMNMWFRRRWKKMSIEDEESDEEVWFWHVNMYNIIIKVGMASFVLSDRKSCILSITACSILEDYIVQ